MLKNRVVVWLIIVFGLSVVRAGPTTAPVQVNLFAMGDWGTNGPKQREVADGMGVYASKLTAKLDAVLLAGDNFYINLTGPDDPLWRTMFEDMYEPEKLNAPFYVALGNHDYQHGRINVEFEYAREHPESRWKLPANWFRVDIPEQNPLVTVLVLNTNKDSLTPEQWNAEAAWIDKELASRKAKWVIAVAHHPLFSNGQHGDNGVLQAQWGPLFKKYNLDFYICGHDHDLQHLEMPGFTTSFVLCGGGGGGVRPMRRDNRGPFSESSYGFVHLKFTNDATDVNFVDRSGNVMHTFTKDKDGKLRPGEKTRVQQAVPNQVPKD